MIDFKTKRGFICDMDGVLYHGNKLLPGATEFIQWLQAYNKEYLFLTNNSGFTPRELHIKLLRMGIDVSEEHFYTSALATAEFIRSQNPKASAYVLGEAGLLNALYDAGIAMSCPMWRSPMATSRALTGMQGSTVWTTASKRTGTPNRRDTTFSSRQGIPRRWKPPSRNMPL